MEHDLKQKAAIAGVLQYLQFENEQLRVEPVFAKKYPSPWQLNGRTSIMQMRGLVQRRVLKRRQIPDSETADWVREEQDTVFKDTDNRFS